MELAAFRVGMRAAADALMREPTARPFLTAIDGGSVVMTHLDIAHAS